MRKFILVLGLILLTISVSSAKDKVYQTGKLLDVDSQLYTKMIDSDSYVRHENTLSVQVGDVIYVGQCEEKRHFSDCKPADWIVGDPISVRFDGNNMFLRKLGGGEVKTKLVKRTKAN